MPATNSFESAMRRARPPAETRATRSDPNATRAPDKAPIRGDSLLTLAGYATACPEARARIRADHAAGLWVSEDLARHLALVAACEAGAARARAAVEGAEGFDDALAALPAPSTPHLFAR